jgi:hypothetical protein
MTSIQHHTDGTSLGSKARKRNERVNIIKEEVKLSIFANNVLRSLVKSY